ncbi:DUF3558 domain-containing protein [Streptomyces sp. SP18CS02]|uniref:DUF3558 domain-containing protein n=1 Tax=Streptomyces sp. SP18CS02 TaxID=3002531 RepID=UPI002E785AB4|nr:DUF3558 domain-containing protein [Streptomyces sp. SP18CS02]MEE1751882.1 DUF3558 domain-containing protein [Streptomyces sp. SP18CS02]
MHRSAPRLTRILACAAVPVMLVVAGCSSDSDSKSDPKQSAPAGAAPTGGETKDSPPPVQPAKYLKLPTACKAITEKTIEKLVPEVKTKSGTPGKSSDTASRGSCSWNGLDDKGVKGSQYRWLDISLLRYDSDTALGSGEKRAQENFDKEVAKVQATEGATAVHTSVATGVGNQATAISYGLKKTDEDFKYAAIVTRTENAVITVSFNGAGYAGAKTPDPADLMEDAVVAAKEAVAAVAAANK